MTVVEGLDQRILATDTLGTTLLNALVGELRTLKTPWDELTQQQQDARIERLRQNVKHLVRSVATVLFAADYPACSATLSSVKFSKGITATIEIAKTEKSRHEVADRVGSNVILVVADAAPYLEGIDDVRAAAAQRDLFNQSGDRIEAPPTDESGAVVADALAKISKPQAPLLFGSAAGDLAPGPNPAELGPEQSACFEVLMKCGNPVSSATVAGWTAAELEAATLWAKRKAKYPQTTARIPSFIPVYTQDLPGENGPDISGDPPPDGTPKTPDPSPPDVHD